MNQIKDRKPFYFITFLMILLSSRASIPANSDEVLIIITLLNYFLFIKYSRIIKTPFLFVLGVFCFMTLYYLIIFDRILVFSYLRLIIKMLNAYFFLMVVKERFIEYYEDILVKFSIVSFPLFFSQLLIPTTFFQLNGILFKLLPFMEMNSAVETNSLIFNFEIRDAPFRNSGFAWEPGGFAFFILIALIINLNRTNFNLDKNTIILLVALLTTQSTTGYIGLVILFVYAIINLQLRLRIIAFPITIFAVVIISQLSFITDKLETEFMGRKDMISTQGDYKDQKFISLGRFGSAVVDFNDFLSRPLLGYGNEEHKRTSGVSVYFQRTNGLTDYLARFGFLGIMFLFIGLNKSFKFIQKKTIKFSVAPTLIILILLFSNPIWDEKVFFAFWGYFIIER